MNARPAEEHYRLGYGVRSVSQLTLIMNFGGARSLAALHRVRRGPADLRGRAGVVFGWSLEAGGAGDFAKAAEAFARGAAVVDRLAMSGWGETIIVQSCLRRRGNGRGPEPRPG